MNKAAPPRLKTPKLPLTPMERSRLRQAKIKLAEIARLESKQLADVLEIPLERAKNLTALALFQQIPSIGPVIAQGMIDLGYYSLEELRDCDGASLTDQLEQQYGYWLDPCVEDSLRCIVHHAQHPDSDKQWWDFTDERKTYRAENGYPLNRPTIGWKEAEKG
ncbi:helix-hairpin-helix domain-containing protein [Brevibacillus humidisoli]|uniref:helix-hairpin-helix domain-containing protein n=1 Tax=Brevibacillus humidisoli TaxID=2895522 RepID=UPI001E42E157|nr:helix-hairpin-helix domain-containing protein [Brevibacillus humidisoli]UFJ41435.1 helix-hairpin-helix domain-containing protein [Brevibacillus humidisoli]